MAFMSPTPLSWPPRRGGDILPGREVDGGVLEEEWFRLDGSGAVGKQHSTINDALQIYKLAYIII